MQQHGKNKGRNLAVPAQPVRRFIRNLYDSTDVLRRSKVGDVVEVTVLRDAKPLKASVQLEPRR
jgi:hypothetical protein